MTTQYSTPPPDDVTFRTWDAYRAAGIATLTDIEPEMELSGDLLVFTFPKTQAVLDASRAISDGSGEGNLLQYIACCKRLYGAIRESRGARR
jgi:hypothetical protein